MNLKKCIAIVLYYLSCGYAFSEENFVGKIAPSFEGSAVFPDGRVGLLNLEQYMGQDLVLYFYPKDHTPGCTIQAKKFRDEIGRFDEKNIKVIGVSTDSIESHKAFQSSLALPFPLVSDSNKKNSISEKYEATGIFFGKRKTFLINKHGVIFKEFHHVDIKNQVDDILECFSQESIT
jgi:peroxiredoxin Q/BCP